MQKSASVFVLLGFRNYLKVVSFLNDLVPIVNFISIKSVDNHRKFNLTMIILIYGTVIRFSTVARVFLLWAKLYKYFGHYNIIDHFYPK